MQRQFGCALQTAFDTAAVLPQQPVRPQVPAPTGPSAAAGWVTGPPTCVDFQVGPSLVPGQAGTAPNGWAAAWSKAPHSFGADSRLQTPGGMQPMGDYAGTVTDPNTGITYATFTNPMPYPIIPISGDMTPPTAPCAAAAAARSLEALTGNSALTTRPCRQEMTRDWADALEGAHIPPALLQQTVNAAVAASAARDTYFTNRETPKPLPDTEWAGYIGSTYVLRVVEDTQTVQDYDGGGTTKLPFRPNPDLSLAMPMREDPTRIGGPMGPIIRLLAHDKTTAPGRPVRDDVEDGRARLPFTTDGMAAARPEFLTSHLPNPVQMPHAAHGVQAPAPAIAGDRAPDSTWGALVAAAHLNGGPGGWAARGAALPSAAPDGGALRNFGQGLGALPVTAASMNAPGGGAIQGDPGAAGGLLPPTQAGGGALARAALDFMGALPIGAGALAGLGPRAASTAAALLPAAPDSSGRALQSGVTANPLPVAQPSGPGVGTPSAAASLTVSAPDGGAWGGRGWAGTGEGAPAAPVRVPGAVPWTAATSTGLPTAGPEAGAWGPAAAVATATPLPVGPPTLPGWMPQGGAQGPGPAMADGLGATRAGLGAGALPTATPLQWTTGVAPGPGPVSDWMRARGGDGPGGVAMGTGLRVGHQVGSATEGSAMQLAVGPVADGAAATLRREGVTPLPLVGVGNPGGLVVPAGAALLPSVTADGGGRAPWARGGGVDVAAGTGVRLQGDAGGWAAASAGAGVTLPPVGAQGGAGGNGPRGLGPQDRLGEGGAVRVQAGVGALAAATTPGPLPGEATGLRAGTGVPDVGAAVRAGPPAWGAPPGTAVASALLPAMAGGRAVDSTSVTQREGMVGGTAISDAAGRAPATSLLPAAPDGGRAGAPWVGAAGAGTRVGPPQWATAGQGQGVAAGLQVALGEAAPARGAFHEWTDGSRAQLMFTGVTQGPSLPPAAPDGARATAHRAPGPGEGTRAQVAAWGDLEGGPGLGQAAGLAPQVAGPRGNQGGWGAGDGVRAAGPSGLLNQPLATTPGLPMAPALGDGGRAAWGLAGEAAAGTRAVPTLGQHVATGVVQPPQLQDGRAGRTLQGLGDTTYAPPRLFWGPGDDGGPQGYATLPFAPSRDRGDRSNNNAERYTAHLSLLREVMLAAHPVTGPDTRPQYATPAPTATAALGAAADALRTNAALAQCAQLNRVLAEQGARATQAEETLCDVAYESDVDTRRPWEAKAGQQSRRVRRDTWGC